MQQATISLGLLIMFAVTFLGTETGFPQKSNHPLSNGIETDSGQRINAEVSSQKLMQPADTGYSDFFDGELKATASADFNLELVNGQLHIQMHTQAKWQGVSYAIGKAIDISASPILNLKIRTDVPFVLSAYIVDAYLFNMLKQVKVYATGTFTNYLFDFSDFQQKGVDATRITNLIFTPNGASRGLDADEIYFDDLRLGSDALKLAGIGAVPTQVFFREMSQQKIEIPDILHASRLQVTGGEELLTRIQPSAITGGRATISLDCQTGKTGNDTLQVTAVADSLWFNNSIQIPIHVEDNLPPTIDPVPAQMIQAGVWHSLPLTGISDGNGSVEQTLTVSAGSNYPDILPDSTLQVIFEPGSPIAILKYKVLRPQSEIQVTISLDDGATVNHFSTINFRITAFAGFNHPPHIEKISDQDAILHRGRQTLVLRGLSDGDSSTQNLTLTASSSDESVVPADSILIEYKNGDNFARLSYVPLTTGRTQIEITLSDDGGTSENNGNQQIRTRFLINVREVPPTGSEIIFSDYESDKWRVWSAETEGSKMFSSYEQTDDGLALKFRCAAKWIWNGIWLGFNPLNLTRHPTFSMEVKVEDPMYFWMWFWDADTAYTGQNVGKRNTNFNIPDRAIRVQPGVWTRVTFDFSDIGLADDQGTPLLTDQIVAVLLNFHHQFYSNQGTPDYTGNVWFRNLKIGDQAEGVVPKQPVCTLNPVPDQIIFQNSGSHTVILTGITDGAGQTIPTLTASSSNPAFIPNPVVSPVAADSSAILTCTPGSGTGQAVISLAVSAAGSRNFTRTFKIAVISPDAAGLVSLSLERDRTFQTIRGFGTFDIPPAYMDLYTADLGASAMRLGLIENQIEPVNDNNHPDVLDLSAFNHSAFDWEKLRRLKENGVETFILTSWSPPAWMKRNLSVSYFIDQAVRWEDTDNILEPAYYDEFAESMLAAVKMFKNNAGIDLAAIGPQNEPAFNEPYPSAILSPAQFRKVITKVGKRLAQAGLQTKIYMPEQVFTQHHYSMEMYLNALFADSEADAFTDIIATHSYAEDGIGEAQPEYSGWQEMWQKSQASISPKELWMTETDPKFTGWNSALQLAGAIHGALTAGNVSLWCLWNIDGTLINAGKPNASYYTSKNYYKYIRPGALRIKTVSDHPDVLVSGFEHLQKRMLTVVAINKGHSPQAVVLEGLDFDLNFQVFTSAENRNFEYSGSTSGRTPVALPARSVVTFTGTYEENAGVRASDLELPVEFQLFQNYPNPFNPATTIEFQIPVSGVVSIQIFNILGQQVRSLVNSRFSAGRHTVIWDGRNNQGSFLASGIYLYQIRADKYTAVKKLILLR